MKERTWRANAFPLGGPLRSRVADLIPDKRQPQGLPFRLERKTGLGPAAQQAAPCYYVTPLRLRRFPPRGAVVVAGRQRSARNAERQPQGLSFIIWSGKRGSDPRRSKLRLATTLPPCGSAAFPLGGLLWSRVGNGLPEMPNDSHKDCRSSFGAENGARTRDLNLGKVALYQLSYFRVGTANILRFL